MLRLYLETCPYEMRARTKSPPPQLRPCIDISSCYELSTITDLADRDNKVVQKARHDGRHGKGSAGPVGHVMGYTFSQLKQTITRKDLQMRSKGDRRGGGNWLKKSLQDQKA